MVEDAHGLAERHQAALSGMLDAEKLRGQLPDEVQV